jgi:DNA-binding MarR family transcriptional regulator
MGSNALLEAPQDSDEVDLLYDDDSLYEFVIKFGDVMQQPQNCGAGIFISMIERHLLKVIGKNPGITASRIAGMWNRTKGAISPQVKKLEANGYIKKVKHLFNEKTDLLYLTPLGESINDQHMRNDVTIKKRNSQRLLRHCTSEEIDAFHKVLREYTKILDDCFSLPAE